MNRMNILRLLAENHARLRGNHFREKSCAPNSKKDSRSASSLASIPPLPIFILDIWSFSENFEIFRTSGHSIEFIIGDFTAQVGDPSGQSALRPTLKPQQIWENAKTYQDQILKVLDHEKTHSSSTAPG